MYTPLNGLATVNVQYRLMHPDAREPVYSTDEAAGADLFACEDAHQRTDGLRSIEE